MDRDEVFYLFDALKAYDCGATDSGVHDPNKKAQLKSYLRSLPEWEYRALVSEFAREHYFSDEAISAGYGLEDAVKFAEWLEDL